MHWYNWQPFSLDELRDSSPKTHVSELIALKIKISSCSIENFRLGQLGKYRKETRKSTRHQTSNTHSLAAINLFYGETIADSLIVEIA